MKKEETSELTDTIYKFLGALNKHFALSFIVWLGIYLLSEKTTFYLTYWECFGIVLLSNFVMLRFLGVISAIHKITKPEKTEYYK